MQREPLPPEIETVLLTEQQIRRKVSELAAAVSADYGQSGILAIGVLKGAFIFLADLVREITVPVAVDFMAVSSYADAAESSGEVRIIKDVTESLKCKHVLLVEDIIDTGITAAYLRDNIRSRGADSVKICALLDKPARRVADVRPDYVGFTVPDEFVVGYGLDYAQRYRGLPFVAVLKKEVYTARPPALRGER